MAVLTDRPPGPLSTEPVPPLEILSAEVPGSDPACPGDAETWVDAAGGVFARCQSRGGHHWLDLPGLAAFRFGDGGHCVSATPRPGVDPASVADAYRHSALPLVLQALGREVLHASAVVARRRVVVALCGASGSGKSTIAYGLHRRGLAQWADDAVALDISDAAVEAVPLPFDVRLRPGPAALFGLGSRTARLDRDSGEAPLPLAAACVLDRTSRPGITRLRPAAAFPAVLAHAFCFRLGDAARKRVMLSRYLSLIARVPVWAIGFDDGLEGLATVLDLVERVVGEADAR